MLKNDITEERKQRHTITQEDFTPPVIVDDMIASLGDKVITDFSETVIDNSCGIGNFLVEILSRRLNLCKTHQDIADAVNTIYGVELMADNVEECRTRLYNKIIEKFPDLQSDQEMNNYIRMIIINRIRWGDSLKFNYNKWYNATESDKFTTHSFNVPKQKEDVKYPMWFKQPVELSLF